MFCQYCGGPLDNEAVACPKCDRSVAPPCPDLTSELKLHVRESSRDAAGALQAMAKDPVSGLPTAFASLGPARALGAGIALCALFSLAATVGLAMGARHWLGAFADLGAGHGLLNFLKTFVALLVLPAAFSAASLGLRKVLRATPPLASDVFTAGSALMPLALAILASGVLGLGNFEIVLFLLLVASTYLVLILYTGLTMAGGLSSRAGAPAVPVLIALAMWLSKIVFAALF